MRGGGGCDSDNRSGTKGGISSGNTEGRSISSMEGIGVNTGEESGSRFLEFPAKLEEGPEVVTKSKSKSSCSDASSNKEQA